MKHSISLRALFFLLCVMVALVALVSLPVAAQETTPSAPSVAAAASSSAPAPYNPAAAAFATPKPAPAANSSEGPDPDRHWEVEVHGGGNFPVNPTSGSSNLPNPGLTFNTVGPSTTRAVPSFYFGDGALLTSQFVTALGNPTVGPGVTPLDAVLNASIVRRQNGGDLGGRVSYDLNRRVSLEVNLDYSFGELAYTGGSLINAQATSDSWQTFFSSWVQGSACGICSNTNVSSTLTVRNNQGHTLLFTGNANVNWWTTGKFIPYVTVGVGLLSHTGDTPSMNLAGTYQYLFVPQAQTYIANDNVTVLTSVADNSFVGTVGVGFKYYVTPRWGVRVDVRDYISANSISTLLSANGGETQVAPGTGNCVIFGVSPDIQDCNDASVGAATLSGPAVSNFHSFSGSGAMHQVAVTGGLFFRF